MSAGYAVVDAMVALLIISLSLALSLQAFSHSRRAIQMANEQQEANRVLIALLEDGPRSLEATSGRQAGFEWTLQDRPTGAERPVAVCRRDVRLQGRVSGKAFAVSSLETCPELQGP